jgi:hypothetical protein
VFGSADLCAAIQANILPRTFTAGWPYAVVTSTSGNRRAIDATALKVVPRGMQVARF